VLHDFIGLLGEDEITYSSFQQDSATAHTAQQFHETSAWDFSENMSPLETYCPLARRILLHQTFICGEQQILQCSVIAHTYLIK